LQDILRTLVQNLKSDEVLTVQTAINVLTYLLEKNTIAIQSRANDYRDLLLTPQEAALYLTAQDFALILTELGTLANNEIIPREIRRNAVRALGHYNSVDSIKPICKFLRATWPSDEDSWITAITALFSLVTYRSNLDDELRRSILQSENITPLLQAILVKCSEELKWQVETLIAFILGQYHQKNSNKFKVVSIPLQKVLVGHSNWVLSVAFSPDGKLLASGSGDSTVRLWEVATGQEITTLLGHNHAVNAVAFSPDGKLLASGSGDNNIKLWNVVTGQEITTLAGHTDAVSSVVFSPDGKLLASGSGDSTVRLWEVATGQEITTLPNFNCIIHCVAFSLNGLMLASGFNKRNSTAGGVQLWQITIGQETNLIKNHEAHTNAVKAIAFKPDQSMLATGGNRYKGSSVNLWQFPDIIPLKTVINSSESVDAVAFSPNGKFLASSSSAENISVTLWDAEKTRKFGSITDSFSINSLAFDTTSLILVAGSSDCSIKLWDLSSLSMEL